MPAAARAKSAKTKLMNGKVVSSRSKTGSSECSAAMSEWVTTRKSGSTPASVFAILGQCRAKARALKQASQHKAAGNEAKAQRLEAIAAGKKGPVTAKDRMALAKEKRATLNAKRAANPITAAMQGGQSDRQSAIDRVKAKRLERTGGQADVSRVGQTGESQNARPAIDHSVLSPSGKVSKRAENAAKKRESDRLFGKGGMPSPTASASQPVDDAYRAKVAAEVADNKARAKAYAAETRQRVAAKMQGGGASAGTPATIPPPKPNLKDQVAAHRAKKNDEAGRYFGKVAGDGTAKDRALLLAVRAQKTFRKARTASLRADKAGKTEVAAKKDAAYRTNFARSENLAIKSGFKQPKNVLDVTDSVRVVSSSPASPQPAQAKAAGRGT